MTVLKFRPEWRLYFNLLIVFVYFINSIGTHDLCYIIYKITFFLIILGKKQYKLLNRTEQIYMVLQPRNETIKQIVLGFQLFLL